MMMSCFIQVQGFDKSGKVWNMAVAYVSLNSIYRLTDKVEGISVY